jgi:hypothetical protein
MHHLSLHYIYASICTVPCVYSTGTVVRYTTIIQDYKLDHFHLLLYVYSFEMRSLDGQEARDVRIIKIHFCITT